VMRASARPIPGTRFMTASVCTCVRPWYSGRKDAVEMTRPVVRGMLGAWKRPPCERQAGLHETQ
jgi:hypothetical protein